MALPELFSYLFARLGIEDLYLILKEKKLRWYGHVERSNNAVKTAFDIQVDGKCGSERTKMEAAVREGLLRVGGSSRLSTLMIDLPGDMV